MPSHKSLIKNRAQIFSLFIFCLFLGFWWLIHSAFLRWCASLSTTCSMMAPASNYSQLLQGLVCGKPLPNDQIASTLKLYSLTHLIVISGSHFLCLEKLIQILGLSRWSLPLCWGFNIATGFQPPGTRAVVDMTLKRFFKKRALFYPKEHIVLLSWILVLIFMPGWYRSLSLFLSTACSWLLTLSSTRNIFSNHLLQALCFYLLFSWIFFDHPFSILTFLVSCFLSLAISGIVFPCALLAWCLPFFVFIFDRQWDFCFWIFHFFESYPLATTPFVFAMSVPGRTVVLVFVFLTIYFFNHWSRQEKWN